MIIMGVGSYAQATPLALDYSVTNLGGGTYDYEFSLSLDNNDGSWSAGQWWGWIVFGDAPFPGPSPLTDFVLDMDMSDFQVGPFTSYSTSGGAHNGPTFTPAFSYWTPTSVGDSLNWSGRSTADLAQGDLLFSTLVVQDGAVGADFEVANRATAIPEPSTLLLLGSGLVGLGFVRRRFKS